MLQSFVKLSHKKKMEQNEEKLKKAIIRSTNSIKKKYRDLHKQRLADEQNFKLQYKPLIEPLNRFIQSKEQLLNFDKKLNENLEISKEIQTSEDLISEEIPQSDERDSIDDFDERIDKQIDSTSTCETNNSPTSLKTINDVTQPLFKSGNGIQTEYMILDKKSDNLKYTYWDDPNELIDRLRLLVSSSTAGHNAHNNEIVAIIEELREANIIF